MRMATLHTVGFLMGLAGLLFAGAPQAASVERPDDSLRARLVAAINSSDSFEDRFDAEVWLSDMSNRIQSRVANPRERRELLRHVHIEAMRSSLEPELVLSVIQVENNFDRFALSHAGARGLMQVMPFWLDEIGRPGDDLFHVRTNLRMGCTILRYYLDLEKGDLQRTLAHYNGSLGKTWYQTQIFNAHRNAWYP
jgi:soluble lytic murein transglycosylase-like protein